MSILIENIRGKFTKSLACTLSNDGAIIPLLDLHNFFSELGAKTTQTAQ